MKIVIGIVLVVVAAAIVYLFYRNALERSKSSKTSLFGSFNNEYGEKDNLFKVSSGTLEGLDEAERLKKEKAKEDIRQNIGQDN